MTNIHKRNKRRRSQKAGLPPGTLVHVGDLPVLPVKVELFSYGEGSCKELLLDKPLDFKFDQNSSEKIWLNIDGISDTNLIAHLGKEMNIHSLVLEDVMNATQRPKIEDFGNYFYLVLRMLKFDAVEKVVLSEQVSFVVGKNWVVSFQEGHEGDVFNPIRERIKSCKGNLVARGADYLLYSLLDVIVDHYFECLEKLGDLIEEADDQVVDKPEYNTLASIHNLKKNLITLRRSLWPLREVMGVLERAEFPYIHPETKKYFRDVYDHTIQIMETVETHRDMVQGLMDIYLTTISNQQNSIMKTLTLVATIFMPLTFIVGVYGMNFKYLPELEWKYAYPMVWGFMVVLTVGMVVLFKKKKWV